MHILSEKYRVCRPCKLIPCMQWGKKKVGSFWSVILAISSAYEIHTHWLYVTEWIYIALTRVPEEIWQITEVSLCGVSVMIPNKCLGNKPISVHVSNLQHFPLLPLYWLLLICTGIHWLFYGLTHLMNHHTVKSSLWVQESKSKSAGHTPIQPIQQFLHSRINARVWKRAMHNKNNLLLVLKSVALDTMQPDEILGFGLQPHLLVMIGHCKLYAQSDQHFYSIKPYVLKLNLSTDKQFSVPSTSSVFLWLKGGELPQAFPWQTSWAPTCDVKEGDSPSLLHVPDIPLWDMRPALGAPA